MGVETGGAHRFPSRHGEPTECGRMIKHLHFAYVSLFVPTFTLTPLLKEQRPIITHRTNSSSIHFQVSKDILNICNYE